MKPVSPQVEFPQLEQNILEYWSQNNIEEKGLQINKGKKPFVFYDGPPFATGLPHYGHLLPGTLKDIVPRYWSMKGHHVERRWGWDCHGLPVEYEMEKILGLNGLHDIEEYGIARFNEACRSIVLKYTSEWEQIIKRTGRWVDFENGYKTMDPKFMESVWWVIKTLWEKDLIFEGYRVLPYSWRVSTPLSNFESNLNYKTVQDPSIAIKLEDTSQKNRFLVAWTTTPWTLISNLALAVHNDLDYVELKHKSEDTTLVFGKEALERFKKPLKDYEVSREFKGTELVGTQYKPLFPYFESKSREGAFQVFHSDHVSSESGTGIVHMAPYGEDDFTLLQRNNISLIDPVSAEGNFTEEVPEFKGRNIKEADKDIIKTLKEKNKLFHQGTIEHSYPFCWRTETPLIYKPISTWFLRMNGLRDQMVESNKKTHWVPEHIKDGRFGKWIADARDWNISRNRFWGTPIPLWRCENNHLTCIGSKQELEELTGQKVDDLHKHFVDDLTLTCKECGETQKRIPEVLDCWFESGSMPYAQAHYPFENKEDFDKKFPADFIAEGLDQTRGWFYTLTVLGNALFGKTPFKNVIVNGLILAEDGKKMSKRLKNYPEVTTVIRKYGADALRAYLTTSPAARADELRFSEKGVKEMIRSVLLPYWNAYSFFVTYALADNWKPESFNSENINSLTNDLDKWVVSKLMSLIKKVEDKMEIYHLYEVIPEVLCFIDDLTNWYIRLNRRRFWKEESGTDKEQAYRTLYFVLSEFTKILAPILPFVTEEVFQNIKNSSEESVHFCQYPEVVTSLINRRLEDTFHIVQDVIVMGRNLRNTHKLKVRQPLAKITVITPEGLDSFEKYRDLIQSELNIKSIEFTQNESEYVGYKALPNLKLLGKKLGPKMKNVALAVKGLNTSEIKDFLKSGVITLENETLNKEEILIQREPLAKGLIQSLDETTICLDDTLTHELIAEGVAREFVNRIQKLRKDMELNVSDRILTLVDCDEKLKEQISCFESYICQETLSEQIQYMNIEEEIFPTTPIDEFTLKIKIEVVS